MARQPNLSFDAQHDTQSFESYWSPKSRRRREWWSSVRLQGIRLRRWLDSGTSARRSTSVKARTIGVAATKGPMDRLLVDAGVKAIQWNLEEIPCPFPDAGFDAVLMTEVFEHLREYPVRALREVRRVLKPGGRLLFTTPNQAYLVNRIRLLFGRNVQTPLPDRIAGFPLARHAREYTFGEIEELLAGAGLKIRRSVT